MLGAWGVAAILLAACGPNLEQPEGVLGLLAEGCAAGRGEALFSAFDERTRFALDAIVAARRRARSLILAHYPEEARRDALAQLGPASELENGAQLLAVRCPQACRAQLCEKVSALASVAEGPSGTTVVRTVRGGEYVLHRNAQGRYGVVFETEALSRERGRAFAELSSIEANVKVYASQKALR